MALRLEKSIVRGEIDNTEAGMVRGKLWLLGREEPVVLTLQGNAWRDVAGSRLTFENPHPVVESNAAALVAEQNGVVGDLTASRKVKHLLADLEEAAQWNDDKNPPSWEWRNAIYIEWFSERNGRVVIETCEFSMQISEHAWTMDEAEEQAQRMTNEHAMRDFMDSVIQRSEPSNDDTHPDEMTEDEWELQLQASERLTDAYMEALDKYEDDPEIEDKTNFAMGWDHMIEGGDTEEPDKPWLADLAEAESSETWKQDDDDDDKVPDLSEDLDDDDPFDRKSRHPLHQRTFDYTLKVMNLAKLSKERRDVPTNTPLDRYLQNSLQIGGKVAGVLTGYGKRAHQMPKGMILATLRRCLNWSNEALAGLLELKAEEQWQPHLELIQKLEAELFGIREDITNVRRELQK